MNYLEQLLAESKEMTDNTKYLLGYESVLIRIQSEIIQVLSEAIYTVGVSKNSFDKCQKALEKAESLAKEALEK